MASSFKTFVANDIANTRSSLHESIPLTGALASGTYGTWPNENNIKNFAHGMFQSCWDYPFLSSSANHIYDLTFGFSPKSAISSSTPVVQQEKKINIYNTMAQVLAGYDHTGSLQEFDTDGNLLAGGTKIREAYFINFARLLYKDEIKKGSFTIKLGVDPTWSGSCNGHQLLTITDAGAQNDFRVNSPAGEYGILSASAGETTGSVSGLCGLVFYQAGIAVLTASVFNAGTVGKIGANTIMTANNEAIMFGLMTGSEISGACDSFRHRLYDLSFNNTTELNSTIYFCRAHHNEFNYSSNPTYLTGSKIRVKNNTLDEPVSYITTVGLYSADSELLAVAKLSECIKKTPSSEVTLRVRLDY